MKKALVLAMMLLMGLGVWAFAGPYFSVETTMGIATLSDSNVLGLEITPVLTGGYDFSTSVQSADGTLGPRTFGDASFTFPANDLDVTLGVGFTGIEVEVGTLLAFDRALDTLDEWNTSFTVTGSPYTGLKAWGELSFNFDYGAGEWSLVPVLGIKGHW